MRKFFVITDCQNDFITGSLANPAAQAALPKIKEAAEKALEQNLFLHLIHILKIIFKQEKENIFQ